MIISVPMGSKGALGAVFGVLRSEKRNRALSVRTLTPEQESAQAVRQERVAWNAAVEQRKAAKLAAKGKS